jgi:uncharacterized protein (TIGR02266 family)
MRSARAGAAPHRTAVDADAGAVSTPAPLDVHRHRHRDHRDCVSLSADDPFGVSPSAVGGIMTGAMSRKHNRKRKQQRRVNDRRQHDRSRIEAAVAIEPSPAIAAAAEPLPSVIVDAALAAAPVASPPTDVVARVSPAGSPSTRATTARIARGTMQEAAVEPPRRIVTAAVDLDSHSNFYTGLADDISEGGVFVASDELLRLGTDLRLEFSLPDIGDAITARGVVRWLRLPHAGAPAGMGIQFLELRDEDRQRIARFVKLREPLFYDD